MGRKIKTPTLESSLPNSSFNNNIPILPKCQSLFLGGSIGIIMLNLASAKVYKNNEYGKNFK